MKYSELHITSNFSFLRGASHPEELVQEAACLGYNCIAITDRNTVAGVVRAHAAGKKLGIRIIPGARLDLTDGFSVLALPISYCGWSSLTNILSTGNLRAEKGDCRLYPQDLFELGKDLVWIALPPDDWDEEEPDTKFTDQLVQFKKASSDNLFLAAKRRYTGRDALYLHQLHQISNSLQIPLVATNDVHYHHSQRRALQDVVTCIREKCTIYNAGFKLHPNAERYLKPETEMLRLFRLYPDAINHAGKIAALCTFSLDELRYEYPVEICTPGKTPMEELTELTWEGARFYFGESLPEKTRNTILYELRFIEQMNYASYFLTVYDLVRFARSRDILCQGRGSAANSTVCFCLGITSVNPTKFDLLFERFISSARNEPPDIDVDFEHERREEVIQYIYEKYGRHRAAIVATVTQQHGRGAFRDVAKAMGISNDLVNSIAKSIGGYYSEMIEQDRVVREQGLNTDDAHLKLVFDLTREFMGFPRQLGQHTGGFVITKDKLTNLCPVLNARMENRTCIEWNKDDIDTLGFMKIDVLALGMLTCIRKAFTLTKQHYDIDLTLANIPQDDPVVYDMICKADTIGVFQIESRAQQSMLPRLKPRTFYDLVIEVAIVRPGPIQGDMVHPYLRRRNGEEPVTYPSQELKEILGRTLGVPLFQEQAMKIAIVAAGFTPAEADELRRSMATFKAKGLVNRFEQKLIQGMIKKGYSKEYARRIYKQLEGFGSYGFPESHAASFAQLVYISSWLKCYYPDVFGCAILNSLPMGFYQPAQLVGDARKHGVEVREADINHSQWDHTLEECSGNYCALRLGFRIIKGLQEDDMQLLVKARIKPYTHVNQLRDAGISQPVLVKLAEADAFRSLGFDRRQALWQVSVRAIPVELYKGDTTEDNAELNIVLPAMQQSEHVVQDYATTSLSIKAHPVFFVREKLTQLHVIPLQDLEQLKGGEFVKIAGLVLVKQRPETASGVCFMTLEDETGIANLVIFENIFSQYRREILQSRLFMAEGKVQREGDVIHVIVSRCYNISRMLHQLTKPVNKKQPELGFEHDNSRAEEVIPAGRSFR